MSATDESAGGAEGAWKTDLVLIHPDRDRTGVEKGIVDAKPTGQTRAIDGVCAVDTELATRLSNTGILMDGGVSECQTTTEALPLNFTYVDFRSS